jgi:Domain of unknown function (DUF5668)
MRGNRPPLILPLLLVALGAALLLQNFRLIEIDLLRYWPVLLIVAGIQLLLRGDLGLTWQSQTFGITRGDVAVATLDANAGELDVKIRPLRREGRLIAGQYTGRSRPQLKTNGDQAYLTMRRGAAWAFSLADWEIGLARDLPWTLMTSAFLGEIDADLRGLHIRQADFGSGFGDIRLVLPETAEEGVRVKCTFGNINLTVPEGGAAVIRVYQGPLMRAYIDEQRFIRLDEGLFATLGYDQSEILVYAEVGSTFGAVRLN